jgi:hypothetical protein
MQISLDKEPKFTFKTKTLGELFAFNLLNSIKQELRARLGCSIKKADSTTYVRTLISVCCHTQSSLIDGKYRPSDYSFTLDDTKELSKEELEAFASLYLEHNDYLYKEIKATPKPKRDGTGTILTIEPGDIEHPRNKDESSSNYLYRVSVLNEEKEHKQAKKMMRKLGMTGFSKSLQDQINSTMAMGNQLKNTMRNIGHVRQYDPSTSINQHIELAKHAEETRLRPFRDLSGKLDELIDLSTNTTNFIVEMNETQTTIAAALKNAGEKTTLFAKINIAISILIICLTAFSLWVGYKSVSLSSTVANRQIELTDQYASDIIKNLNEMNGYSKQSTINVETSFEKLIEQQTTLINELKDTRLQEEKRLELLLNEVKEKK